MQDDELTRRFDNVDARLTAGDNRFDKIAERFDEVDARFSAVDKRFDKVDAQFSEVNGRFSSLEHLVVEEAKRTRSHFDAVAERLGDDIKLIAEGYDGLRTDVTELKGGQHGSKKVRSD